MSEQGERGVIGFSFPLAWGPRLAIEGAGDAERDAG